MDYAGEVTAAAAYEALAQHEHAVLVDCRTKAEWTFVGVPDLDQTVFIEWSHFPGNARNEAFLEELASAGVDEQQPVYFICRSGQRSRAAAKAASAAGYRHAYNVSDGFEGPVGPDGHRSTGGWKASGLPWKQT